MRPFVRALSIAVVVGLIVLVSVDLITRDGFPFLYNYWVPGCAAPGFACRATNPLLLGIDYLFWLILAFGLVVGVSKGLQGLARLGRFERGHSLI